MPNAKVLEAKKNTVAALSDQIKNATAGVFVDYKGITVDQDTELRNQFRAAGVHYSVVKNTLTRLAARECGYDFDEILNGTTSFAMTTDDPIAPARIVSQFAKQNKILTIKGGFVEGEYYDKDGITQIASIPSRDTLISKFMGSIQSPIANFARVINQVAEKNGGAAPAAEAAE